ncbi:MAG: tripartite tricarboxylate transporter substrate binding protein [Acetobacteraceae bacterium]|nr:tripartite tricarboxylate transporter substrate binding protein [Acetobacteraceae bacterium]
MQNRGRDKRFHTGRRHLLGAAAAAIAASGPLPALAQRFPDRPLRMIVPFAPGGAVDLVGRVLAQEMGARLGQSIVVDNRSGASGSIGAQAVARSEPDGYVMLMAPITSFAMTLAIPGNNFGLDLEKDLFALGTVGVVPLVVAIHPSVPVSTLAELIAYAKANPDLLTFASAGNGSTEHLAAEMFMRQTGTRMVHVPYRGGAPAITDLVAGQVKVMFPTAPTMMQRGAGTKVLAVAAAERIATMPDVPTTREAGLPDFEVASLYGVLLPAGPPPAIVDLLSRTLMLACGSEQVRAKLAQQGITVAPASPRDAKAKLATEVERWAKLVREAGITF